MHFPKLFSAFAKTKPTSAPPQNQEEVERNIVQLENAAMRRIRTDLSTKDYDPSDKVWSACRGDFDGVWHCVKCRHENPLVEIEGPNPLGYLKCGKCEKLWSSSCVSTNVLRNYTWLGEELAVPKFKGKEPTVGQMCTRCGLSHRVRLLSAGRKGRARKGQDGKELSHISFSTTCICGEHASAAWPRFKIGDNSDYRRGDPNEAWARSLERRLGFQVQRPSVGAARRQERRQLAPVLKSASTNPTIPVRQNMWSTPVDIQLVSIVRSGSMPVSELEALITRLRSQYPWMEELRDINVRSARGGL